MLSFYARIADTPTCLKRQVGLCIVQQSLAAAAIVPRDCKGQAGGASAPVDPGDGKPNLVENHRIVDRCGHLEILPVGDLRHGAAQDLA